MKKLLTLAFAFCTLSLMAQNEVNLNFVHMMGDDGFEKFEVVSAEAGYDLYFTRLQYYISEIELIHDGGQVTPVEETWLLVDAAETNTVSLGTFNIEQLEGLNFYIGVDPDHNHLDPSTYPADHPLAPQSPSMHWGWAAGYRFVCMEGKSGLDQSLLFQVHALGDANYYQVNLSGTTYAAADGAINVGLGANYLKLLTDVDVSTGLIEHSEVAEAKTLLQNISLDVFYLTEAVLTSDKEVAELQKISVSPNPATDNILIGMGAIGNGAYEVRMIDMYGRTLQVFAGADQTAELSVTDLASGLYQIQVWQKGQLVAMEKLLVTH